MYFSQANESGQLPAQGKGINMTAHPASNGPYSSYKSRSLKETDFSLQCSFQKNLEEVHIEQIWNASIKFVQDSILEQMNMNQGFNSSKLFSELYDDGQSRQQFEDDEICIQKVINENKLIKYEEKLQFVVDLKNQTDLTNFIMALYSKFHNKIFSEILVVIHKAWQSYLSFKSNTKLSTEWNNFFLPKFFSLKEEKINTLKPQVHYTQTSVQSLTKNAEQFCEKEGRSLYIHTNIEHINLREAEIEKKNDRIVGVNFEQFLKSIVKSVFLCAEGIFYSPENPKGQTDKIFASFESRQYWEDEEDMGSCLGSLRKIHQAN